MAKLFFAKVREDAIVPSKRDEDAGYDIYANFEEPEMIIPAHQTKLIPTGIAAAVPNGYYLQVEERGSTGAQGIKKSAGVIDSGYRGEIFIAITNANGRYVVISKKATKVDTDGPMIVYPYGKAIAQLIVHEVPTMQVEEITYDDLLHIKSERGTGALGSSRK